MPLLGCIADDFTGATDLASMLVRGGARCVQTIGVPSDDVVLGEVDAIVVALKTRTEPKEHAVQESLNALQWLQRQGCQQFYFKYCSTFDSTSEGNIGPVTDALLDALGESFTIACPALPENRRTVFNGYLFANDVPLNESGMQDHPLTPMRDANLMRVLTPQTRHSVGLIDYRCLEAGPEAVRVRIESLRAEGTGIAVCDAIENRHLDVLGAACEGLRLVTAGSGLALGLASRWRACGALGQGDDMQSLAAPVGRQAILSGSCSRMTLSQLEQAKAHYPAYYLDPHALMAKPEGAIEDALAWSAAQRPDKPVLLYASSNPEQVQHAQRQYGVALVGERIESAMAQIAQRLVREQGVGQLLVAGGETSGAVVRALGVQALHIGPSIAPGVPWTQSRTDSMPLTVALKSGNFGGLDFMVKAWEVLDGK
ncbi:3-oxo-tetronate kinase [Pseudomonas sp. Marseille-QA0892]